MGKIEKSQAGYVHVGGVNYFCEECWKFLPNNQQGRPGACLEVKGEIAAKGSCNTWVHGPPAGGQQVAQVLTKLEAGYAYNPAGYTCARCPEFDRQRWDCKKVDKDSKGADLGLISPQGCCNLFEVDELFGGIK